jgi:hypothetical protein
VTRYPGVVLPTGNQNVCRPVMSARAVFLRSPVSKCATALIRAPGMVDTATPTLVPSAGCLRVTVAVPVSGAGVGEALDVALGAVATAGAIGTVA